MEAGGKGCEEETLQTAFKKLRVDAESLPGAGSVSEALAPRAASRACLDASGAKPKLGCTKDNRHGCKRKTSRGASRTQRRRRSKSAIVHPPKFTQELSPSAAPGHISSPVVFGSCNETRVGAAVSPRPPLKKIPAAVSTVATSSRKDGESSEDSGWEKSACEEAEAPQICRPADAADTTDFRALSELHNRGSPVCQQIREKIIEMFKNNVPQRKIGRHLLISPSTVHNIIKRFKEFGGISVRKGQGRKPKLNNRDLQALRQHCIKNLHSSISDITTWAQDYFGKPLSINTIRSYIHKCQLKLYCAKRKLQPQMPVKTVLCQKEALC